MDHVLLPPRPRLHPFNFPLLCELPTTTYERGNWQSYPPTHGYQVTGEISGEFRIFQVDDDGGLRDIIDEDSVAVAAFFQEWLWFGILLEMLESVDAAEFVREDSDGGKWLSTVKLQGHSQVWVRSMTDRLQTATSEAVQEWAGDRWRMIRRARTVVMRIHQSYEYAPDDVVSVTILAVALLCEHLHKALGKIYDQCATEDAWDMIPVFNWRDDDADCAMPVMEKLTVGGWCPRTLAGMGINTSKIETLWFYANMEAPKSALGHGDCSADQCVHLQVDQSTYRTKHVRRGCECDLVGPDPVALAEVVIDGNLPLTRVVFGTEGRIEKINVEPREMNTNFVAISHVWADGHGNPEGNLLPSCFLRELQGAVDEVAGADSVLFWMDTLSIPREPRSVRKQALKRLRDPYEYAAHVLVLDAYLQSQTSQDCSVVDLLALVNVSSWAQRLWTFQEGRLAKDIQIQFADGMVRMSDGDAAKDALRSEVISEVPSDVIALHTSTKSTDCFWEFSEVSFTSIEALRMGVRLRSTSVAADEALCLGSIMGLDMGNILDQSEIERMSAFWVMVPKIPASLAISKASVKLEKQGLRWAPASLMGDIELNEWEGPTTMLGELAKLSPEGLVCQLSALKFPSKIPPVFAGSLKALYSVASDADHEFHSYCNGITLRTQDGEWLVCDFEEPWHQIPVSILDGESPAILLEQPTRLLPASQPTEDLPGDNISALFVSRTASFGEDTKQAHGVRHCSLYFVSKKQCTFLEELDAITHQLMNNHWDDIVARQAEWDQMFTLIEELVPEHILGGHSLRIGREVLIALRGTDDVDDQAVLNFAVGFVASFCYIGPHRHVEYEGRREAWVID